MRGTSRTINTGETKMTLPTNDAGPMQDELANRELSIEELDAIAAGSFWSVVTTIAKDIYNVITHPPIWGTVGPGPIKTPGNPINPTGRQAL
jgi:hypothetical protein